MSDTLTDVIKWNDALKRQLEVNAQIKEELFTLLRSIYQNATLHCHCDEMVKETLIKYGKFGGLEEYRKT